MCSSWGTGGQAHGRSTSKEREEGRAAREIEAQRERRGRRGLKRQKGSV